MLERKPKSCRPFLLLLSCFWMEWETGAYPNFLFVVIPDDRRSYVRHFAFQYGFFRADDVLGRRQWFDKVVLLQRFYINYTMANFYSTIFYIWPYFTYSRIWPDRMKVPTCKGLLHGRKKIKSEKFGENTGNSVFKQMQQFRDQILEIFQACSCIFVIFGLFLDFLSLFYHLSGWCLLLNKLWGVSRRSLSVLDVYIVGYCRRDRITFHI